MALYYNDLSGDKNTAIYEELESILKYIKVDNRSSDTLGTDNSVVESLRNTAEWMIYNKEGNYDLDNLVQRLSINFQTNNEYIVIVKEGLKKEIDKTEASNKVLNILNELRHEKKKDRLKRLIAMANADINFGSAYVDVHSYISRLTAELEDMQSVETEELSGYVGKIDFTDDNSIEEALSKAIELTKEEGGLNTGFKGFNDAVGGRVKRGLYVNFGALTYCYKSGILLDLTLNVPAFTDPWMFDVTKKPLILRISFENTIDQDIIILYKRLYEMKTGKKYSGTKVHIDKARTMLKEHFQQKGYCVSIENYNPNDFSIYDLFSLLNKYISAGYEIHAVVCDYSALIAPNTPGDSLELKLQKTAEIIRNYCYPKGITFFTAHQLSTQAQDLARENHTTFVSKVRTGGWYMSCRALHTKFDLEIILHVFTHIDGNKYLMVSKGKHRLGESIPEKYCTFIYKFEEIGGIPVDAEFDEPKVLYSLPKSTDINVAEDVWG